MLRQIIDARKILTDHKFDKLMYKQEKGASPTFAQLVEKYKLVKLIERIDLTLDQELLGKIAALKAYIRATRDNYNQTLIPTCEVLEDKYRQSLQGTHKTLLFSLYDTKPEDVKRNTEHKCPYRWFQFKELVQPCINKEKATATLNELNNLYRQNHPADLVGISDDCTLNAYILLGYIKHAQLPKPQQQMVQLKPQFTGVPIAELLYFLTEYKEHKERFKLTKYFADTNDMRIKLGRVVRAFNNLSDDGASTLNSKNEQFVIFNNGIRTQYNLIKVMNDLNVIQTNMDKNRGNDNSVWLPAYDTNPQPDDYTLNMVKFNAKIARFRSQRGGAQKRQRQRKTRRLRS
jgi:hypothetical protein